MSYLSLSEVLLSHDLATHPHALKDNLGDAYLLNQNPVIATIRALTREAKFKFKEGRYNQYDVMPLVELPNLLASQKIPYTDNVKVLREIEAANPGQHRFENLPPIKMNPIFHESAHVVAHTLSDFEIQHRSLRTVSEERIFALQILIQESFANATESFANVYSDTPLHNEFFYLNSYVIESTPHRVAIVRLAQALGKKIAFQVLMLSFLHANCLHIQNREASLKKVIRFLGLRELSAKNKKLLTQVFQIGLNLDPEFTEETNAFCLAHLGIKAPLKKLFHFDFMAVLKKDQNLKLAFDRFSEVSLGY